MKRSPRHGLALAVAATMLFVGSGTAQASDFESLVAAHHPVATATREATTLPVDAAPPLVPDETYAISATGARFTPDPDWTWIGDQGTPSDGDAAPFLLDPVDLVQCNIRNNASHTVTWWTAKKTINYSGGRTDLKCGTQTSSGYKHIKFKHQSEWQDRANEIGGGAWDDMMNWVVGTTLEYPSATYTQSGLKACYTTTIAVVKNGKIVKTYNPRIIVSVNNKIVITAIPGGGC